MNAIEDFLFVLNEKLIFTYPFSRYFGSLWFFFVRFLLIYPSKFAKYFAYFIVLSILFSFIFSFFCLGVDIIYGALKSFNAKLLETPSMVRQFFDDDTRTKIKLLSQFLQKDVDTKKALLSSKDDDPEWFEGIQSLNKKGVLFVTIV